MQFGNSIISRPLIFGPHALQIASSSYWRMPLTVVGPKTTSLLVFLLIMVLANTGFAQQRPTDEERARRTKEMLAAPNLLATSNSPWIDKLTYMEVRDKIRAGYSIAIVPTGGIEQNGPYLVTGKHNLQLEVLCPAIAAELGNALCAPIVPFVPEGSIDPPSGHMLFPGTISVRAETFHALLDDIASSLKQSGFTDIVLIGDSGGNQRGLAAVVQELSQRWVNTDVHAYFVGEFYKPGWEESIKYAQTELGVTEPINDGHHDDVYITAVMMSVDPETVRYQQRVAANLAVINGVKITPSEDMVTLGQKLVKYRAKYTADAIRAAIAGK